MNDTYDMSMSKIFLKIYSSKTVRRLHELVITCMVTQLSSFISEPNVKKLLFPWPASTNYFIPYNLLNLNQ